MLNRILDTCLKLMFYCPYVATLPFNNFFFIVVQKFNNTNYYNNAFNDRKITIRTKLNKSSHLT